MGSWLETNLFHFFLVWPKGDNYRRSKAIMKYRKAKPEICANFSFFFPSYPFTFSVTYPIYCTYKVVNNLS